jgi:heme-degrading monooxygenase HmoA
VAPFEAPVFARLHTLTTTPEQAERGRELVASVYLPWARELTGFRGLIRLVSAETGTTLVFTLWADEEALEASTSAAEDFGLRIAEASGATYRALEDFEVNLFDVEDAAIRSERP